MDMKYFIYCRKSSEQEDRQVLSLPAQDKELNELVESEKLVIVDAHDVNDFNTRVYAESQSAHWAGRPKFDKMLERIKNGEANGIIVWDESRIARNARDSGEVIYMLDLQQLIEIRKPGKTYKNTPDDKSWLAMCFMMSKKESDDKGVNVKRGLRTKAEQGWFPSSWTKPGYMWDRFAERGNKTILNDPVRFALIKKCWELMYTGAYTVPQIWRKLNNEWGYKSPVRKTMGGKPMKISQMYVMFGDPFYYGWYERKDADGVKHWQRGNHEPMINEEQFDRVQILLGRGCKQRMRKNDFPLTGIIRCGECNAMVTAEEKWQIICSECKYKFASQNKDECPRCHAKVETMTKPKILHYLYYHCTKRINPGCTQKYVLYDGELGLKEQVETILKNIRISERFKNWAIKYLNELNDEEIESHTATITSLQTAFNDTVKRLDNLVKLKISPQNSDGSLLSDDEFKSQKIAILAEKEHFEDKLRIQGQRITNWVDNVEEKFDFAIHALYKYETGTSDEKREIVVTIGSNMTLFDKHLIPNLQPEFSFLEKAIKEEPSISYGFEPKKGSDLSINLEASWAKNLTLLPVQASTRMREWVKGFLFRATTNNLYRLQVS